MTEEKVFFFEVSGKLEAQDEVEADCIEED